MTTPLTGIYPPLVTPLKDPDTLDVDALARLIEHVLAGGVHGLFLLGTTGEGPGLSQRLKAEVVERGCNLVARRVPIMVGVTDNSVAESVGLAERAAAAGAHSVVLAPPSYFPASQSELAGYVERTVAEMPLPVVLYHIPSLTRIGFDSETVARLVHIPRIIGLKDSGGNMQYQHEIRRVAAGRPDFTVLVGPEELLAEAVLMGAHGGMCGGANMFPKLYVDLYHAARAGDLPRVRELHDRVMAISTTVYEVGGGGSSYFRGLKCALKCLGLCDDVLVEPYQPFSAAERDRVSGHLVDLGLLSVRR